jgi:hypothetical protein
MQPEDRVELTRDPTWTGTVKGVRRGKAHVEFDGGGVGWIDIVELQLIDPPATGAWPPRLETKSV